MVGLFDAVDQIVQIVEPIRAQIEDVDARSQIEGQLDLAGEAGVGMHLLQAHLNGAALVAVEIGSGELLQSVFDDVLVQLAGVQSHQANAGCLRGGEKRAKTRVADGVPVDCGAGLIGAGEALENLLMPARFQILLDLGAQSVIRFSFMGVGALL